MISLIFKSYMDRKKYLLMWIYEIVVILLLIAISINDDEHLDLLLNPNSYNQYFQHLYIQIFVLINAMFVLFLAMDHDQIFFKPFFAYFHREKVLLGKYMFHALWICYYIIHLYMLTTIIFNIFIPIDISFNMIDLLDLYLDMFILLNMVLIMIKHKFKSLSVLIIIVYIAIVLFIDIDFIWIFYIIPIFNLNQSVHLLELIYKICYIYLGFLVYMLKSLKEEV